jgi:MFS family permease
MWRLLADVVMVLHGALLLFFLLGGFLAWRWPKLICVHLGIVAWNLVIVLVDFGCPVTATEKYLRRRGGETPYAAGYIEHYLDGKLWPQGATPIVEKIGFVIVVASYVGFVVRRRRANVRGQSVGPRT